MVYVLTVSGRWLANLSCSMVCVTEGAQAKVLKDTMCASVLDQDDVWWSYAGTHHPHAKEHACKRVVC
jgi:hypothetical protein